MRCSMLCIYPCAKGYLQPDHPKIAELMSARQKPAHSRFDPRILGAPLYLENIVAGAVLGAPAQRRGRGGADHRHVALRPFQMRDRQAMVMAVDHEFRAGPADHGLESIG